MTQDNSLGPPEKSNLEKLVDSTPAYKVMGCLLIVGLVWGFIQEWFILGGGDPLSFSLLFFYLGRAFGFVLISFAASSVITGIKFAIDRDRGSAKRWWAGSYVFSGIAFAYFLLQATP